MLASELLLPDPTVSDIWDDAKREGDSDSKETTFPPSLSAFLSLEREGHTPRYLRIKNEIYRTNTANERILSIAEKTESSQRDVSSEPCRTKTY
jgi:hypothetical protein